MLQGSLVGTQLFGQQLVQSFFIAVLQFEELGAQTARLPLRRLQNQSGAVGSLQFHQQLFDLRLQTQFGFLQRGAFGLGRLRRFLHRLQFDHQLFPRTNGAEPLRRDATLEKKIRSALT
ncbi:hypothetical protein EYF80_016607 [Liparis tanakae]|uniref:Uncharacterized protein n=1 Tax=Liparis tanakae TaxID=230148 RepID=A0A4Z2I5S6_9TELE|nr:hypothetical protein EYF80_016607 [Liparis tanakae]